MSSADLDRLRAEYARRQSSGQDEARYSSFNRAYLFATQQRQRHLLDLLRRHGVTSLRGKSIFEMGCGRGGVLLEWQTYGASPAQLHGIDLLEDRLVEARQRLAHASIACADGQALPYPSGSFDFVLQYTAFSSVLDDAVKRNLAQEMLRVLRKPDGMIIWYDFWLNPTNDQTRGIRPAEIRALFPDCAITFRKITLAPPVARRLVKPSWLVSSFLEKLRLLNTHYLALIRPTGHSER